MNTKERFDTILSSIEKMITENRGQYSDHDIADQAFANAGWPVDDRSKNVLFSFLLDQRILEYISERRLMIGYRYLLSEKDKKIAYQKAWQISGAGDQAAYINKFKKKFGGITPVEARKIENTDLYKAMPSWDMLGKLSVNTAKASRFGISMTQYQQIQEAMNLQSFYGLNDLESDLAFRLFEEKDADLKDTFEYVRNYLLNNMDHSDRDSRLEEDLLDKEVRYLYFDCAFGFDGIFTLLAIRYRENWEESIRNMDIDFLKACTKCSPSIPLYQKQQFMEDRYQYYLDHQREDCTIYNLYLFFELTDYVPLSKAIKLMSIGIKDENVYRVYRKQLVQIAKADAIEMNTPYDYYEEYVQDPYYEMDINEAEEWEESFLNSYDPEPNEWDSDYDEYEMAADAYMAYDPPEDYADFLDEMEFDLDYFEQLCIEMSENTNGHLYTIKEDGDRALSVYHNLDVEAFFNPSYDELLEL